LKLAQKLNSSFAVQKLALDLGLGQKGKPVANIVRYCEKRIHEFMKDYPDCPTLGDMLEWVANKVGTSFIEVDTDADLDEVRNTYLAKGEKRFVELSDFLAKEDDFGVTFRLRNREPWELEFVSIIDRRDNKSVRAYFTKWHEIAHLMTQTKQMRFAFRRTHSADQNPDEERLMDAIAGRFGFFPPMVHKLVDGEISFEMISRLRDTLCPTASYQASLINFARFWPSPVILIRGELAYKQAEKRLLDQLDFGFTDKPQAVLRAIHVTASDSAVENDFTIFPNMRVPERSVINRVFTNGAAYNEAEEDLSWWESSDGWRPLACPVRIMSRYSWDGVDALIIPLEQLATLIG